MAIRKITAFLCAMVCAAGMSVSAPAAGLGDVDGSGEINVTDIAKLATHIKRIKAPDNNSMKRADVNKDNKLNVTDIAIIASHIKGVRAIDDNTNSGGKSGSSSRSGNNDSSRADNSSSAKSDSSSKKEYTDPNDLTPEERAWQNLYGDPLGWGYEYWYWWNKDTGEIAVRMLHP